MTVIERLGGCCHGLIKQVVKEKEKAESTL
jgi:hypothetical protein